MDWNAITTTAITAVGSGGSAFLGAFLRFKQRLKAAEDAAATALRETVALSGKLAALEKSCVDHARGWRLEFDGFKEDYARDLRHSQELNNAVEDARASRPDPAEILRHEVEELKKQLERMKERQARYVRSETFVEHTKAQETQWKEIARTLGRLEALAK